VKIVLDTNVFISGVFFSGSPAQILEAWRDGRVRICISPEIFEEYRAVAERIGAKFPPADLGSILGLVAVESEVHQAESLPDQVCEDPDDDKFLACAIAAGCEVVVSGDKGLIRASGYEGIQVLSPRVFVDRHLGHIE
jgi:putative PIN family toxin of toxin-antitoxin system